jgi:hypothetical protein
MLIAMEYRIHRMDAQAIRKKPLPALVGAVK